MTNPILEELVNVLKASNYEIANSLGQRISHPDNDFISILAPKLAVKEQSSWIMPRADYIGVLWLNNPVRKAKFDETWILEVYGRQYIDNISYIISNYASGNGINLKTRKLSDTPFNEFYPSDFDSIQKHFNHEYSIYFNNIDPLKLSQAKAVAAFLTARGYGIADIKGIKTREIQQDYLGILKRDILPAHLSRDYFIGILWLDNQARKAKHNKQWVLESFGRLYLPKLKETIEKIASSINIGLKVENPSEKPRIESLLDDYDLDFARLLKLNQKLLQ